MSNLTTKEIIDFINERSEAYRQSLVFYAEFCLKNELSISNIRDANEFFDKVVVVDTQVTKNRLFYMTVQEIRDARIKRHAEINKDNPNP